MIGRALTYSTDIEPGPAERARDRMAAEINAARRDPYQRAADDEAARRAQAAKAAETYAHRREVEALMRPGGRHG